MQDNAPGHMARSRVPDLTERGIACIKWPAYPPDLNLIKSVWSWMKDYIYQRYSNLEQLPLAALEHVTEQAWRTEATPYRLIGLVDNMPARLAAAIKNYGGHTVCQMDQTGKHS